MIDEKMSESDRKVLKQILGEDAYRKMEKLEKIIITYAEGK